MSAAGFGVIDFVDLIHNLPNANAVIQKSIRDAITEYEPRLRNVRVRAAASEDPLVLAFEVSARLTGDRNRGLVRVRTKVSQAGRFSVE